MSTTHLDPSSIEAALLELAAQTHRVRPSQAARELGVSRSRLQKAVEFLESRGLAYTAPNPHDERSRVVCLTPQGQMRTLELRTVRPRAPAPARSVFLTIGG
jgi:DNA-binding MarR family transcriptional regulator